MITLVLFLLGFAMICAGFIPQVPLFGGIILGVVGVVILGFATYVTMYKKFFRVATGSEAVIRTGGIGKWKTDKPVVAIAQGMWVFPKIHQYKVYKFQQLVFTAKKIDELSLLCRDMLLANVEATFKVCVPKNEEAVLKFYNAVGDDRDINSKETMEELVLDTLDASLRDACTGKEYDAVFNGRDAIAGEIENSVKDDFGKIGVELSVSKLTNVSPTGKDYYNAENPQHAKGLTLIVEITQGERLKVESKVLDTNKQIKEKTVATQKLELELDRDREFANSAQKREIAVQQAQDKKTADENVIAMAEVVEKRQIAKDMAVEVETVAKERNIETQKVSKQQAIETANVEKTKAIEVANRDREISIAEKDAMLAAAEEAKNIAEAKAVEAEQKIVTVREVAEAKRDSEKVLIKQEAASEQELIKAKKAAEADAYAVERKAEADKTAAEANFLAQTKAAEAALDVATKTAAGEKAKRMVAVEVAKEEVAVRQAGVEVTEKELKVKTQNLEITVELEIKRETIIAFKEIGIAEAKAKGEALSKANLQIFGDTNTLENIQKAYFKGSSMTEMLRGFMNEAPNGLKELSDNLINAASAVTKKFADKSSEKDETK